MTAFLIRCDAGPMVGRGHQTRCLALALALRVAGGQVAFATRGPAAADQPLVAAGFSVLAMPAGDDHEGSRLREQDLAELVSAARAWAAHVVVVDHYGAGPWFTSALRREGLIVGVLEDLGTGVDRPADWVLNQNPGARSHGQPGAVHLGGLAYALLRPEFALGREVRPVPLASDARVLVTFGGGDTAAVVREAVRVLHEVPRALEVRCLVARGVRPFGDGMPPAGVAVCEEVADMVAEMRRADLSVNAGGTTCWELMCLGVPMVVLPLSPDQLPNALAIEAAGCGLAAVPGRLDDLAAAVERLLADPALRGRMSAAAMLLVDGGGAERAAASLLDLAGHHSPEAHHVA